MTLYIMTSRMQKLILIWHFFFWQLLSWSRQPYFVLRVTWRHMFRVKRPNSITRKYWPYEIRCFDCPKIQPLFSARSNQKIIAANWYKITRWNPCQICPWQSRTCRWRWRWKPYTKKSPSFSGENFLFFALSL